MKKLNKFFVQELTEVLHIASNNNDILKQYQLNDFHNISYVINDMEEDIKNLNSLYLFNLQRCLKGLTTSGLYDRTPLYNKELKDLILEYLTKYFDLIDSFGSDLWSEASCFSICDNDAEKIQKVQNLWQKYKFNFFYQAWDIHRYAEKLDSLQISREKFYKFKKDLIEFHKRDLFMCSGAEYSHLLTFTPYEFNQGWNNLSFDNFIFINSPFKTSFDMQDRDTNIWDPESNIIRIFYKTIYDHVFGLSHDKSNWWHNHETYVNTCVNIKEDSYEYQKTASGDFNAENYVIFQQLQADNLNYGFIYHDTDL